MEVFDVQLYENENEARAWFNGCVIDIRPGEGKELNTKIVTETLTMFGCSKFRLWKKTDWGWAAKFSSPKAVGG